MNNDTRFAYTPLDICSSTIATLIRTTADASHVFTLLEERFDDPSYRALEAMNELESLLSCWDTLLPEDSVQSQRYWFAVCDSCEHLRQDLHEHPKPWTERLIIELLLGAFEVASTKQFMSSFNNCRLPS